MASLLLDPPWDRAVGVTDCQETLWLSVHILEALQVPFPGHVGPWGVTEEQVVGGEADSRCSSSSRVRQSPSKAWAALPRRRSRQNHPVHSFESRGEGGSRRLHHWQGKKPSQITQTTKSHRRVSHSQKFQL